MLCYQLEEFLYDCVLLLILGVPVNQNEYESLPKKLIDNEISVGQKLPKQFPDFYMLQSKFP